MIKKTSLILFFSFLFFIPSCTSDKQYKIIYDTCDVSSGKCTENAIEFSQSDGYTIGYVEFDDQGEFMDSAQFKKVEGMVKKEAGITDSDNKTAAQGPGNVVIVLFVHGWQHNACYDDGSVKKFKDILIQLSNAEKGEEILSGTKPRKIIGVYAGWRGLTLTPSVLKPLSFWDRKNTAGKVGQGAISELMDSLENIQKKINDKNPVNAKMTGGNSDKGKRSELIVIGHSFGGAIVFSALSRIITERMVEFESRYQQQKTGTEPVIRPFGDLVILLNPAFEASRYYNLYKLSVRMADKYSRLQMPVLAVLTSKGDTATEYWFNFGRFFSTFFERYRDNDLIKDLTPREKKDYPNYQKKSDRVAVGWFEPFVTHDLSMIDKENTEIALKASSRDTGILKKKYRLTDEYLKKLLFIKEQRKKRKIELKDSLNQMTAPDIVIDRYVLKPKKIYVNYDPILNVSVDISIFKDHGNIDNENLIDFIWKFIVYTGENSR